MPTVVGDVAQQCPGLVIGNVDIGSLSDDDLYQRLADFGLNVGPIVDTTRELYQRKLYNLMSETIGSGEKPSLYQQHLPEPANDYPTMETRHRERAASTPKPSESSDIFVPETEVETVLQQQEPPPTPLSPQLPSPISPPSTNGPSNYEHYCSPTQSPLVDKSESRSPYFVTTRRAMHNGASPYEYMTSPEYVSHLRSNVSRNIQPYRTDNRANNAPLNKPAKKGKKSNKLLSTAIEVVLGIVLLIVGYIFYTEMKTYDSAEKEFVDSQANALNMNQ